MPNLNVWLSSIVPDTLRGQALGGLTTCTYMLRYKQYCFVRHYSSQQHL